MASTQYVPPARLLTMAEIQAANLAEALGAALLANQVVPDEIELPPPPPLVRCTGNIGRVDTYDTDTDTDTDTDMSNDEYKSWYLRNFGYPMPPPIDPCLPPQL
jgi:hypothetical protein